MSKIKLDLNSEQNILNMLMESSSLSEDQMSKINANSKEIGKSKLETAIELNFTDETKIQKTLSTNYSLELISLEKKVIDPKIKKIIDLRYIQDNLLVPFEMSNGTLKIAIYATDYPYRGSYLNGYKLFEYQLDPLDAGTYYYDVSKTGWCTYPPSGSYSLTIALLEYISYDYKIVDYNKCQD